MTILVTGCMGFIASNLIPKLLNNNYNVIGFDDLSNPSIDPTARMKSESGENWKNFIFFKCSITEIEIMGSFLTNYNIDYIIHLAAIGSVMRSFIDPSRYMEVNIKGTTNIFLLASRFKVKKIIFASSSSVYGSSPEERIESNYIKPLSPYALTKMNNENFAEMWNNLNDLNYIGLRFFNIYGPGQRFDSEYSAVIPKFITSHEFININGDGSIIRDFTYVDDACHAIYLSIITSQNNQIFNVGTGIGTSIKELALLCSDNKTIKYLEERKSDVKKSIANTNKSYKMLGFKSCVTIEEGIKKVNAYYLTRKIHDNA